MSGPMLPRRWLPIGRRFLPALLLLASAAYASGHLPPVHEGDILFQTSRSTQSLAIQRATHSPYSHMGVVLFKDGRPFVFEAVATVRYTPLAKWIARGQGGHYVLKRLANAPSVLTPPNIARLHSTARGFEGRPYDLTFEWSDRRIYCSELVWKVYQRALHIEVGQQQRLREFKLDDPTVQAKLRERYGAQIPLDEPVISPVAMFNSEFLQVVTQE
jgi:hypothetical protein